jgi:hypothetical protein
MKNRNALLPAMSIVIACGGSVHPAESSIRSTASTASLTSTVTDAVGDISISGQGTAVFAYQDIVSASISLKDGTFIFVMDLAAAIPRSPELPNGAKLLEWRFGLRTDRTTCASGFPYPPGASTTSGELTHCAQYMVFILWDGAQFTGMLIDRTPSVTGGDAVIHPIAFHIKGAEIVAFADSGMIGNPERFTWVTRTETWFSALGSLGFVVIDAAPDEGTSASWPANAQGLSSRSVAEAAPLTCERTDPEGDASIKDQAFEVPPYQDIVKASITRRDNNFILEMGVASPIPRSPLLSRGVHLLDWTFRFDTDASTAPSGFPWSAGDHIHGAEYVVFILWDGLSFSGILIDRRPLLVGAPAVITSVPFEINGSEIVTSIDAAMIGDPSSVRLRATTDVWFTDLGTEAFFQPDSVPDVGTLTWPCNVN